jgi:hypothetical protein
MAGILRRRLDYGGSAAWKKWESWVEREYMEVCESFGWIAARTNLPLFWGWREFFFFYIFRDLKLFGFFPFKISTVRLNQWLRIWFHLLVFGPLLFYFFLNKKKLSVESEQVAQACRAVNPPLGMYISRIELGLVKIQNIYDTLNLVQQNNKLTTHCNIRQGWINPFISRLSLVGCVDYINFIFYLLIFFLILND